MEAKSPPSIVSPRMISLEAHSDLKFYRTMARNFSVDLDNLFKIDNSLADLDAAVDQKYALEPHIFPTVH
jgi:cytidylate kinase